jgi:hypothetical protein
MGPEPKNMKPDTAIDRMYAEFSELLAFLGDRGEPSFQSSVDSVFKKTLAIAAASFFEHEVTRIILAIVDRRASGDDLVKNFIRNKAIERKYHTLFNWEGNNANGFFGLFGVPFKASATTDVRTRPDLENSIKHFLRIGQLRNLIAHGNFAGCDVDESAADIYAKYQSAHGFVSYLEDKLRAF